MLIIPLERMIINANRSEVHTRIAIPDKGHAYQEITGEKPHFLNDLSSIHF